MKPTINCKLFRHMSEQPMDKALRSLNTWLACNPLVRVINIETVTQTTGGDSAYGSTVELKVVGIRVWYEASTN